jgi:hypothetical protein
MTIAGIAGRVRGTEGAGGTAGGGAPISIGRVTVTAGVGGAGAASTGNGGGAAAGFVADGGDGGDAGAGFAGTRFGVRCGAAGPGFDTAGGASGRCTGLASPLPSPRPSFALASPGAPPVRPS